jgi:hypothetical protein
MVGGHSDAARNFHDKVFSTSDGSTFITWNSIPVPSAWMCLTIVNDETLFIAGGNSKSSANLATSYLFDKKR